MSNASLTAKHRPQTFAEVAGQETLKAILSRASLENKVAPAYLFSGTRGVGKTTLARIFAKALNCRNAPTDEPCNNCDQCHAVTMGSAVDVIEIDGASNRGIDDVRRLKEVVGYAPMEGRYKIFIIDEAHMLSREAFNALLKTLEEPPANVTFIMATTEPHKFPATIISRCQHFVFKRLSDKGLLDHLARVLHKENIPFEENALQLIARRGAGSVRDSMSLLGQVLALGTGEITEEIARSVLGLAGQEALFHMAEALAEGETLKVAHAIGNLMDQGLDIGFFLREITALWRNLFILRQSGEAGKTVIDAPEAQKNLLLELSSRFSLSHIHACWQMTIEGQRRVLTSMEPGLALELLLMNLAMLPQLLSLDGLSAMARRNMPPASKGISPSGGNKGIKGVTPTPQQTTPNSSHQQKENSTYKTTPQSNPTPPPSSPGETLGQPLPSPLSENHLETQGEKAEPKEHDLEASLPKEPSERSFSVPEPSQNDEHKRNNDTDVSLSKRKETQTVSQEQEEEHQSASFTPPIAEEHLNVDNENISDTEPYSNVDNEVVSSIESHLNTNNEVVSDTEPHLNAGNTVVSDTESHLNTNNAVVSDTEPHLNAGNEVVSDAESHLNTNNTVVSDTESHLDADNKTFSDTVALSSRPERQEEKKSIGDEHTLEERPDRKVLEQTIGTSSRSDIDNVKAMPISSPVEEKNASKNVSMPSSSPQDSKRIHAEWSVLVDWCAEHDSPTWFMPLMKNMTATWNGDTLLLQPKDAFVGQRIMAPSSREYLDPALAEVCGFLPTIELLQPIKQKEEHSVIKEKVQSHPNIKILEEAFDARIVDFGQIQ